jgi:putative Mn2+ efflux pump MntP
VSRRAGKRAEVVGGIALIVLGTKILVEHLSA